MDTALGGTWHPVQVVHAAAVVNLQLVQKHVEGDGGRTVLLQEGHQEAKAEEDHHMHVLEHWYKKSCQNQYTIGIN